MTEIESIEMDIKTEKIRETEEAKMDNMPKAPATEKQVKAMRFIQDEMARFMDEARFSPDPLIKEFFDSKIDDCRRYYLALNRAEKNIAKASELIGYRNNVKCDKCGKLFTYWLADCPCGESNWQKRPDIKLAVIRYATKHPKI